MWGALLVAAVVALVVVLASLRLGHETAPPSLGEAARREGGTLAVAPEATGQSLTRRGQVVVKYLTLAGSPRFREGVARFLSEDVRYGGTGRAPAGRDYVQRRLAMWRHVRPYNDDEVVLVADVGGRVYVVRRNRASPGAHTLYVFEFTPGGEKISAYSKLLDYLGAVGTPPPNGKIADDLVWNVLSH